MGIALLVEPAKADFFGNYPSLGNRVAQAWQGFYVGAHAGYSWANYDATLTPGPTFTSFNGRAFTYGFYGGYNFQWNSFLVTGVESDVTFGNPDDTRMIGGSLFMADSDWTGSIRGRLGATYDQFLFYGTAGFAFGMIEFSGPGGSADSIKLGGVIGIGAEAKITDHLLARAEYLYTSFGSGNYALGPLTAINGDMTSHTLRLGIAYEF